MSGCTRSNLPAARDGGLQGAGELSFLPCLLALEGLADHSTTDCTTEEQAQDSERLWCPGREEVWHLRGWAS